MKTWPLVALALLISGAATADAREAFNVNIGADVAPVDVFARKQETGRPAVIILSGSRGFEPLAYDEIAASLVDTGLDVYLAHLLSQDDLKSIHAAKDSRARIAHYEKRRHDWLARLAGVVHHIRHQEHHAKTGLLGISLGAETAAIAISEGLSVDAAVLVAGVPSANIRFSKQTPPLHLMCGTADNVYPLPKAQRFVTLAKGAGALASINLYKGARHDFFLKPDSLDARNAYTDAGRFLMEKLGH